MWTRYWPSAASGPALERAAEKRLAAAGAVAAARAGAERAGRLRAVADRGRFADRAPESTQSQFPRTVPASAHRDLPRRRGRRDRHASPWPRVGKGSAAEM
ncbi:conserved hypothetical protein [Ricinus communis]|uniref:Uncharacterized protein n=1 Tax=Ricinus communis TaxID=3988 RepID=B9TPJ6_RICCO|nr:conserved hypothetical protein [Ricinus communis]